MGSPYKAEADDIRRDIISLLCRIPALSSAIMTTLNYISSINTQAANPVSNTGTSDTCSNVPIPDAVEPSILITIASPKAD